MLSLSNSLFPLTAFSIAVLNQPCQVYKYNDKSGSEFEGVLFAPQHSQYMATVQNTVMYISLLLSNTPCGEAVLNEYYQSNISKMSDGARKSHRF